jgi:CheY-like chemotaxis protein
VTTRKVSSHLEILVSDNGAGIASEYLIHIFERFHQVDASTTKKHGGLGLGLSIAKNLVEMHGGTISATSDGVGHGATFHVRLPLLPAHLDVASAKDQGEPKESRLELAGLKVLVVDDETDSVNIVRRLLEKEGAHVEIAQSMADALIAFETFTPDVIVSDIGMPEHDGYDLIQAIRALPGGRKVPAVALTALARGEDRSRALRAGFQMHISKPVDGTELIVAVRNLASLR